MDAVDLAVSTLSFCLNGGVLAIGYSRLLPTRHPWLIASAVFFPLLFLNTVANQFIDGAAALILMAFSLGVVPFLLFEGKTSLKVVAVAICLACEAASDIAREVLWALLTGITIPEDPVAYSYAAWGSLPEYAASCVVSALLLGVLLAWLRRFLLRLSSYSEAPVNWLYLAFPAVQCMLFLSLGLLCALVDLDTGMVGILGALVALCLATDWLLLVSMEKHARKRREDQRAALLQRNLDACLVRCDAFVAEAEQTAKMRHDVRNQAHAAMALAERGEFSRARDHISSFGSCYVSK